MEFLYSLATTAATWIGARIYEYFSSPPPKPPPPPPPNPSSNPSPTFISTITQRILINTARQRLGMDVVNRYNFAVCGSSGTGKSTFINCIRNIQDVEDRGTFVHERIGPALIGINETTQKANEYRWRDNQFPHLSLWDLPGGNTQTHPAETYAEDNALYAFDCLLLLKAGRFTRLDALIYRAALKYKIPIAIVLTKVDSDIENRKKIKKNELGRKLTKEEYNKLIDETISMLKTNVIDEIQKADCDAPGFVCMFAIAAQSYRDEQNGTLEETDCPPLETAQLFQACCHIAVYRRKTQ